METVFSFLADQPVLLLFLPIGVDMTFSHVKVKGVGPGAAAVLFLATALATQAQAYGIEPVVAKQLGTLGLTPFTSVIGTNSGASLFHNLKTTTGPTLVVVLLYVLTATTNLFVGRTMGMDTALTSGTFAGAVTNTPVLSAAGEASGDLATATVGYSITYLSGAIGMLITSMAAPAYGKNGRDQPSPLANRTIRVERDDHPFVGNIY